MTESASEQLNELERLRTEHGSSAASRRLELLRRLADRSLPSARKVERLHEVLCFARAYPDNPEVLEAVGGMLDGFAERDDLARHRQELADSGIAGTDVHYRFYWITACWLADNWPERLTIDWDAFDGADRLLELLDLLLPYPESLALDMVSRDPEEWIAALRGEDETDAAFLIRRFAALDVSPELRERLYEQLDVPMRLAPGPDTPSRSRARHQVTKVAYQQRPLDRRRPQLRRVVPRLRPSIRRLGERQARALIDRAREAMVTRARDLDAFAQADPGDVRIVRFGGSLELVLIGGQPRQRLLLEARYGVLMLKNGIPIGYTLVNSLFGSSEIAYNVFEGFRGAEAAATFARLLALSRRLFGADAFAVDPYQLGYGNEEGLRSGAWWFYYKLGFRPHDEEIRKLADEELEALRADPGYRTPARTLEKLAADYLHFHLGEPRRDVLGRVDLAAVGLAISEHLAERFGADRERGIRTCSREAMRTLGLESLAGFSPDERRAWEWWSPLVRVLPGVDHWKGRDKRRLVAVMRAKGGRRESDFVRRFDRHHRLRDALLELMERDR